MKYEIKNRWTGELIYSTEANSWIDVIKEAREKGANLRSADLRARTCRCECWRGPVGRGPVRREPVEHGPAGADLRSATCGRGPVGRGPAERGPVRREPQGADLWSADLRSATCGARTCGRGPVGREPTGAAYLPVRSANLYGADLSPTMVLLAIWGELSEQLTADLMLFDASAHPDQAAFQRWADGGPCPYEGIKVQRAANFKESKKLWGTGKPDTIYNLMVRVLKEKTKQ